MKEAQHTLNYEITRSKRRRRTFALVITREAQVKVLVPHRAASHEIERFIQQKMPWILKTLAKIKQRFHAAPDRQCIEGEKFLFLGKHYPLFIEATAPSEKLSKCFLKEEKLIIKISPEALQEPARKRALLETWYQVEAKNLFLERLEYWCKPLGVSFRRWALSRAESRWGSCNHLKDIRLSWRLIMAPLEIIDYVVVHELCHIVHKNHGPHFWAFVSSVMPDYLARRKKLHEEGHHFRLA